MAQIHYSAGIDFTTGALDTRHQLITRQKHLHDTKGILTKACDPEVYLQKHKRDYKQTPVRRQSVQPPSSMPISSLIPPPTSNAPCSISTAFVLKPNSKEALTRKPLSTKKASRDTIIASIILSVP